MDINGNIRRIRESKGITQSDMAEKIGSTQSNYAYLESRGNKLTIEQLEKIAGALGVSVLEIITGESPNKRNPDMVDSLSKRINELESYLKKNEQLETLRKGFILSAIFSKISSFCEANGIPDEDDEYIYTPEQLDSIFEFLITDPLVESLFEAGLLIVPDYLKNHFKIKSRYKSKTLRERFYKTLHHLSEDWSNLED